MDIERGLTIGEAREKLKHELHAEIILGKKTIEEALAVPYDRDRRVIMRLCLWFSNFFLAVVGSPFRARIIKNGECGHEH